jgi:hypothetical protein
MGGYGALGQVHGALLQGAGRLTMLIPLDTTIRRIGSARIDTGHRQRGGVHPCRVMVAVGQEHRAVRHHPVEVLLLRHTAREYVHRPAAAGNPLCVRVLLSVNAHD